MTDPSSVLIAIVDWSAAASPRPRRPSADACWLGWGESGHPSRPPPEYFRTRFALLQRLRDLLIAHPGRSLIGVDFSLGYPDGPDGVPLLPVGRDLAASMARMVVDEPDGHNNRFEVASHLNRHIATALGDGPGPFWGCPPSAERGNLTARRPASKAPEWRLVEQALKDQGHRPHSTWKLYTTGSVGSQTLLGLAAIGRWLQDPIIGPRLVLWPFDDGFRRPRARRAIVVGEVWPTLANLPAPGPGPLAIKDARQVVAVRDAALGLADPWSVLRRPLGLSPREVAQARREGWLFGLPRPIVRDPSSSGHRSRLLPDRNSSGR